MRHLVVRTIATGVLFTALFVSSAAPRSAAPRLLLIGVDAIPYDVVRELTDPKHGAAALFAGMGRPAALINAYPTNSYVAWTGLLSPFGVDKTHGYESRFFDWRTKTVNDGYDLTDPPAPWKDFFDYRLQGVIPAAIAYGWPRYYSLKELDDGFRQFIESDKDVFSMYVISTDAVGHLFGPPAQAEFMRALDGRLKALRERQRDRPFHVVMFSDHGMAGGEPLVNTWPAIKQAMSVAGLRVRDRLEKKGDVVFIPYGLLSSFVVYTAKDDGFTVARTVTRAKGVDLCVLREGDVIRVVSSHGEARIAYRHHNKRTEFSYQPVRGDPLRYNSVHAQLRTATSQPNGSWFDDADWFAATKDHVYPDALYRISHAFDFVHNPSSLVCSVAAGYMFGGLLAEYVAIPTIGRLRWTHGALHREASLGFLLTDLPGWPAADAVRYNSALAPLQRRFGKTPESAHKHPTN